MHTLRALIFSGLSLILAACSHQDIQKSDLPAPTLTQLSTAQMQEKLQAANTLIIDTRSSDAFNGWPQANAARGGHLPGAKHFSAQWLDSANQSRHENLQKVLQEKGITPDKELVLYDENAKNISQVAAYLSTQGFNKITEYTAINTWAVDVNLPMERYPNYQILVPASWIKTLQDKNSSNTNGSPEKYRIFQVGWGSKTQDTQPNFIPGASRMNTDDFEEGPIWNRLSDEKLQTALNKYGIEQNTLVVLYGVKGADLMAAFRLYAILKYMGIKDVRILDGGFAKWQQAGYLAEEEGSPLQPIKQAHNQIAINHTHIVDMPEAKAILSNPEESQLVDIRTLEEFIGKTPGYLDIKAKGRIPGSYWGQAGSDTSNLNDYRNPDQTMKSAEDILKMWQTHGINPNKRLSFYCGTGWRAAEVLAYAHVMGLKKVSLYDGGWYEWSADPKNPIETGLPPKTAN